MQPDDGVHFEYADGSALTGQGTLIFHVNGPLMALAVLALPRELVRGKRIVGYWAWELPSLPSDWRAGFGYVHEIWVPSRFTAVAVEAQAGSIPVHVVPHPVALRSAAPDRKPRDARTPFTALAIFNMASSFARKNPIAAIEAFRMAFGSDPNVRLIVKCSNMAAYQKGMDELRRASISAGNITLLEEIMSAPELAELYAKAHVLLSLHRSEGFGLAIAEAMLAELPVIATNWSGNIDFLTKQIGVPVGYRLVPSRDPQATYDHAHMHWAEPDIWEAAEALRRLRADPVAAHRLGMEAAAHARAAFGPNCYAAVLSHLLPGAAELAGN